MTNALLKTKLFIPPSRPDYVPRPQLIRLLDRGLRKLRALTLISAPAGYGKTTLLVEWLQIHSPPVAWISVDKDDNEAARFFTYLFAALRSIDQEIADRLNQHIQSVQVPSPLMMMTALINEVANLGSSPTPDSGLPWILVLDDYQAITEPAIHESLDLLLEQHPPGIHLVIVTRQDPPLALSRLRGRDLLTELRQDDLRFSQDESAQFLVETMGLNPSSDEIETLNGRSEGWVVGLQMAALSMRGLDKSDRERFIDSFSGRHRFVLDYLTDEVIKRQTPTVQGFLLQTSILDRMCAELCRAILIDPGDSDDLETDAAAQELLEQLEGSNLFLVPLDDRRRWYRYHHLFAELLQARLQEMEPDSVFELHGRAAVWHEENGLIARAVHHQLLSGDMDLAADMIGRAIKDFRTWSRVEVVTFLAWLQALPDEVLLSRPWLRLFTARSLYVTGESERATHTLKTLENWLGVQPSSPEISKLKGLVLADRASYAVVSGNLHEGITYARRALSDLPQDDGIGRMRATALLALAYYRRGDLAAAESAFGEAIDMATAMELSFGIVTLICNLADIYILQGKLNQTLKACERALRLGTVEGSLVASAGFALLEKGKVNYERNNLPTSERELRQALELLTQGGIARSFGNVHSWLALVQQAHGYPEEALVLAQQAVQIADDGQIERITLTAKAYQTRIWLAQGAIGQAVQWADQYADLEPAEYLREVEELTLAHVLLVSERAIEARALLDKIEGPAKKAGRINTLIQIAVLQALAATDQDKIDDALEYLRSALKLAEVEGFCRVFLDHGTPMARLLQVAREQEISPLYVAELLSSFEIEATSSRGDRRTPAIVTQSKALLLVEPLTERELEVIGLLAEGCSNKEIARRLFLSPNTVRSHTYNLYGKLGVHSRTQAVAKARELNILPLD